MLKEERARFRGFKGQISLWTCTALGAGFVPKAPGTAGTLVGVPLFWAASSLPMPIRVALVLLLFVFGVWTSKVWVDMTGNEKDDQRIVIDEVVGIGMTSLALTSSSSFVQWLAAFIFFRFFDIAKLPPVRSIDKWSKIPSSSDLSRSALSKLRSPLGVMGDDLVAGFQGFLLLWVLRVYNVL